MGNIKRTLRINNVKKKRNLTKRKMYKNRTRRRYYNGGASPHVECPICKEDIKDNLLKLNNCLHQFHSYCIKEWITINPTCPLCRTEINRDDLMLIEKTPSFNIELMFAKKTYYDDKKKEYTFIIDGLMDNDYFGENKEFKKYIENRLIAYLYKNNAINHIEFENLRMEEIKNQDGSYRAPDDFIMKIAVFIASRPDLKSLKFINCNLKGTDFQILVDALLFNPANKLETLMIVENDMLGIKSIPNELMEIYGILMDDTGKVVNEYVVDKTVVDNLLRLIRDKNNKILTILLGLNVIQRNEITRFWNELEIELIKTFSLNINNQYPVDGYVYDSLDKTLPVVREAAFESAQKAALEAAQKAALEAAAEEAAQKAAEAAAAEAAEAQKTLIKKMAEYSVAKLSSGVSKLRSGVSKLPESLSRLFGSKKTGGKNRKKRDSRKVK
jgi:hypothetical protein